MRDNTKYEQKNVFILWYSAQLKQKGETTLAGNGEGRCKTLLLDTYLLRRAARSLCQHLRGLVQRNCDVPQNAAYHRRHEEKGKKNGAERKQGPLNKTTKTSEGVIRFFT